MKIIEATLIMPMTCIILVTLIGIVMKFYTCLESQVSIHNEALTGVFEQVDIVKLHLTRNLIL